jgi:uncharacterized RDD family membrane protein YckC
MKIKTPCPNCGQPLPASLLAGLCPECLLQVGAAADTVPEVSGDPAGTAVAPSRDVSLPVPPMIGQDFGRYRLLRRLGHGGMGVVYEAEERDSGRRVALKVINQKLTSPQDRARFLREGRMAASINHPHCVYVFGTEAIEGTPVIAMELVTGGTLQQRLTEHGPLAVGRAVDAILQVMEGLEAAQAVGILHRDIKPSNCFEDAGGNVKIGDFGLSISTLPREETNITESGVMVGTPAFCSPEQLRGEELSARSDMYAVGVMLYYLLTGKLPFAGQTMPQLIANTLEKRAESPRSHRRDIPNGLARVILRCLHKQPGERFKSYPELRRALEPFASTAPTPATLGLRLAAGMVDLLLLSGCGFVAMLLCFRDPFSLMDQFAQAPGKGLLFLVPWLGLTLAYYGLSEWHWGATPGKALCQLRVVTADRSFPSLGRALLRAAIYAMVPLLPYWILTGGDPWAFAGRTSSSLLVSFSFYGVLALLFATVRRSNGFASVHDLLTQTRVVSRTAVELRSRLPALGATPADVESNPLVGPYHVLEPLGRSGGAEWKMGYDLRLLRRVLLRIVPPGTPAWPQELRRLARPGRLRWLTGSRDGAENWDAFEGVTGQALVHLIAQPQSWAQVRFWLHDLAEELSASDQDGSVPEVLALDRVWITRDGRAKLLDFPAPGADGHPQPSGSGPIPPRSDGNRVAAFLDQVAAAALGGTTQPPSTAAQVRLPLALHARKFLASLPALDGAGAIAAVLKPLLGRVAEVTRLRRVVMVLGCLGFPLLASSGLWFGSSLMQNWRQQNPELMQLSDVMNLWQATQLSWAPKTGLPSQEQFGVYVAAQYRGVMTNEAVWSSALARTFINGAAREFAESSLVNHSSPTTKQLAEAEAALKPLVQRTGGAFPFGGPQSGGNNPLSQPGFQAVMVWSMFLIYVGLPATLAALLFRGGLVLLATGVSYVRRDGGRASRLRLGWRSLVCWSPVFGASVLAGVALAVNSPWPIVLGAVLVPSLVLASLVTPQRGLQDCLAGTWPVPR